MNMLQALAKQNVHYDGATSSEPHSFPEDNSRANVFARDIEQSQTQASPYIPRRPLSLHAADHQTGGELLNAETDWLLLLGTSNVESPPEPYSPPPLPSAVPVDGPCETAGVLHADVGPRSHSTNDGDRGVVPPALTTPWESYSTRMKRTGGVINSQASVHRPPPQGGKPSSSSSSHVQAGAGRGGRVVLQDSELQLMREFRQLQTQQRSCIADTGPFNAPGHEAVESTIVASRVSCQPTSLRAMLDGYEDWEQEINQLACQAFKGQRSQPQVKEH